VATQLLADDRELDEASSRAAELLGDPESQQSELRELLEEVLGVRLPRLEVVEPLFRAEGVEETAQRRTEQLLFIGEGEVHSSI
jgi:hypothetical protein